jgi:hypothetical protein
MTTITYETVTFDWFLRAELGSISSSRCQITRARRHEAERTRIDFLWTRCPRTVFANLFQDLRSLAVCVVACRPKLRSSEGWWSQTGSNRRPHACKARALPAELWPRKLSSAHNRKPGCCGPIRGTLELVVGLGRLELPTSRLSSARSNQLSYKPKN